MKHEKPISQNNSKAKKILFRISIAAVFICATIFIINLPKKIQDDYIKSLPENSQYSVTLGNEIEADSISEINEYLRSFERTSSKINTVAVSDDMEKELLKKSQSAFRRIQLNDHGAMYIYIDITNKISKKLSSYTESTIEYGGAEISADIITTDCYDNDNNISSVFFYQVNITVFFPEWEQYWLIFSPDLENIFAFYYTNSSTPENIYSEYTDQLGWYEYSDDGSYLKINALFLSYLTKNSTEYNSEYFPETLDEYE